MNKFLVSLLTSVFILLAAGSVDAHGWRGGWVPFAAGAIAGSIVAHSYYRPAPIYYGPQVYYYPQYHTAAFCPENGLYYPQTQFCPSGWQRVIVN